MEFNIDKLEFKAKLARDRIDFGFIENRKEFFEWCEENKILSALRRIDHGDREDFYVCQILKPLKFRSKHIRHREFPAWECKCNTNGPGNMLVSLEYIAYAWPTVIDKE